MWRWRGQKALDGHGWLGAAAGQQPAQLQRTSRSGPIRGNERFNGRRRRHVERRRRSQFERSHESGGSTTAAPRSGRWRQSIEAGARAVISRWLGTGRMLTQLADAMSGRLDAKILRLMPARAIV